MSASRALHHGERLHRPHRAEVLVRAGKGLSSLFKGKTIDRLEDCFRAFTEEERLEGNEAFLCSVCQARTPATKVLRIHRFPRALVLHIKRFKVAKGQHVKLSSNVAIPLQGLDLAPFASESCCLDIGAKYDLYALANHTGSLDSGHYTAHAKVAGAEGAQPWCLFADDKVSEVRASSPAVVSRLFELVSASPEQRSGGARTVLELVSAAAVCSAAPHLSLLGEQLVCSKSLLCAASGGSLPGCSLAGECVMLHIPYRDSYQARETRHPDQTISDGGHGPELEQEDAECR